PPFFLAGLPGRGGEYPAEETGLPPAAGGSADRAVPAPGRGRQGSVSDGEHGGRGDPGLRFSARQRRLPSPETARSGGQGRDLHFLGRSPRRLQPGTASPPAEPSRLRRLDAFAAGEPQAQATDRSRLGGRRADDLQEAPGERSATTAFGVTWGRGS